MYYSSDHDLRSQLLLPSAKQYCLFSMFGLSAKSNLDQSITATALHERFTGVAWL
jgi:hypothetical protein